MLEGTCWLPKKKESLPSKENCSWQACVCYMLARRLNKCIELFPGHFSLLLSRLHSAGLWKWKTGEKTKVPLCCASEKAAICGSLCFILEWLRKKIINTMKSKFLFEKKRKKTPFFSVFSSDWRLKSSLLHQPEQQNLGILLKDKKQGVLQLSLYVWRHVCTHMTDERIISVWTGQWGMHGWAHINRLDAWISPH